MQKEFQNFKVATCISSKELQGDHCWSPQHEKTEKSIYVALGKPL